MRSVVIALVFALLCSGATALADNPEFTYVLSGRATQGGEPLKQGTPIEARVGDAVIGATTIADHDGNWTMQVNAGLLRSGICEAVFYINGQQAGRQKTNCSVELQIEVGSESEPITPEDSPPDPPAKDPTDGPTDTDAKDDPPTVEPADDPPVSDDDDPSEEDEPLQADEPDADPPGAEDAQDDDAAQEGEPVLRPRAPETGTGGLAGRSSLPTELLLLAGVAAALVLALNRKVKRR